MDLSPSLFHPRPKVVSSLVRFDRKSEGPQAKDFHNFIQVVKAAFSQRRKKIVNSLAHQLDMGKRQLEQALHQHQGNDEIDDRRHLYGGERSHDQQEKRHRHDGEAHE